MPAADPPCRIANLDLIRGVAVLGILLMNIQAFAMPDAAYLNPAAYGGSRGADLGVWLIEFVLVDGRMRGLFSWLFGASLLLVVERAEAAGRSGAAAHFRRMGWLLGFGLLHLVLVWDGDILSHYALVGCVAFLFRRKPVHALLGAAAALIAVQVFFDLDTPLAVGQIAAEISGGHPSSEALRDYLALQDQYGVPPAVSVANTIALHRGSYLGLIAAHWAEARHLVVGTLLAVGPETLAYMLLGMAGLKSGMLTGGWSRATYRRGALIGFGASAPLYGLLAAWVIGGGFGTRRIAWEALVVTAPLRPIAIMGWACLIQWLAPKLGPAGGRLRAVGRMALSNYLATSLICIALFDGLGLFGRFGRAGLLPVVIATWLAMLFWSEPWLRRFRYGPFEWVWRSLSRASVQPMRIGRKVPTAG